MSKKICAITTVEITQRNFVIPAMRKLKDNGWDITLICNMSNSFINEFGDEFRLINLHFKRGISFIDIIRMPIKLLKIFREENFDLVQYATPNASFYASVASVMAGVKHRIYCQWGIRYVGARGLLRIFLKAIEKITCANSTTIRPASWKNLNYSVSEGLYIEDKASVIGDGGTVGVDFSQFDISKKSFYREKVEAEYPQLKNNIVFSFVGRIHPDKGLSELYGAFKKLRNDHLKAVLLLIGDFEPDYSYNLNDLTDRDDIVVTGWTNEVSKFLSATDVLIHPSHREGFSMVIQQAMAMALPVITTDIPGPSEVIEEGKSGFLVPPRDMDSLYEAMKWMLLNVDQRHKMGESGYERCVKLFSRDRMLDLTLKDRENILNSK